MSARSLLIGLLGVALAGCAGATAEPGRGAVPNPLSLAENCQPWDDWEKPTVPFHIHGDSYYVGTCGIASILILGPESNALIDSGTEAGADAILTNIRKLGIDPSEIEILLASHEHFDHVGGMAKLQRATGAAVIASDIAVAVMRSGVAHASDPQAGMHDPMEPIGYSKPFDHANAPYQLAKFGLVAVETPGHTPGAMSWQWRSCEDGDCLSIVYADSMSPVSRDDFRFSDYPDYVARYRESIARIAALECDILLTPHPSASFMLQRAKTGAMTGGMTCEEYAAAVERRLNDRLAREAGADQ